MEEKRLVIRPTDNPTGWRVTDVRIIDAELKSRIDGVLAASESLSLIITQSDRQDFIQAQTNLDDVRGEIEALRKKLKQPFLDAERVIDRAAKDGDKPLEAESDRLRKELSRVYGGQRREQLEEQREITAYAEKTWEERKTETNLDKRDELMGTAIRAQMTAESVVTTVPGIRIRTDLEPILVDAFLVFQTNPDLLATDLKRRAVKDMVRKLQEDGVEIKEDTIPGIKLVPKDSVTIRR